MDLDALEIMANDLIDDYFDSNEVYPAKEATYTAQIITAAALVFIARSLEKLEARADHDDCAITIGIP